MLHWSLTYGLSTAPTVLGVSYGVPLLWPEAGTFLSRGSPGLAEAAHLMLSAGTTRTWLFMAQAALSTSSTGHFQNGHEFGFVAVFWTGVLWSKA